MELVCLLSVLSDVTDTPVQTQNQHPPKNIRIYILFNYTKQDHLVFFTLIKCLFKLAI